MRTFEEVKKSLSHSICNLITKTISDIEDAEKYGKVERIKELKEELQKLESYIANIDEVLTISIGNIAYKILDEFQKNIKKYPMDFYNNFYNIVRTWYTFSPISVELGFLDIKISDLECFKSMNYTEAIAKFIELMNSNFGTNIPLPGAIDEALNEYYEKSINGDEKEKAQAFMNLREIQRDSGLLEIDDGTYLDFTLLATDESYQQAKEICSSKTYL